MSRHIYDVTVHYDRGTWTWVGYASSIDDARTRGEAACRARCRPGTIEIHYSTVESDGPGTRR